MTQATIAIVTTKGDLSANIQSFLRHLRAENLSPRTQDVYVRSTSLFADFLGKSGRPTDVAKITREHIESFINDLLETRKPATASVRFRSLQSFFKWLVEEGEIRDSPMRNMRPPKIPEGTVPVLREEQISALLTTTAKAGDFASRRDIAILRAFITTGARRAEIANLRYLPDDPEQNDLDLDMAVARVRGKGGRDRLIPLDPKTVKALDRYLRARGQHSQKHLPWLWLGPKGQFTHDGIRQMIERRAVEAGIGHVHAHQLRHSFAHHWLADGGNEGDLMRLAGWRSRTMLGRYAASAAQERALEASKRFGIANRV